MAEVFVGLVHGDHQSYPVAEGQELEADAPVEELPGDFTMADLLRFVGYISPIDGISTV